MKLARTGVLAAAVLSIATLAFAQAKPDFSGTWTPDAPAAAAGGGGGGRGGGMAGPMVVKHAGDTLTIERTRGEMKTTETYKLDGTESVNKMTMGRGENAREVESKSTAKWDGSKLVISTQRAGQDGAMQTSTQTWSLEGGNLTIESTRTGREGAPVTAKTVYKKTT
jgi:hypothetical protein